MFVRISSSFRLKFLCFFTITWLSDSHQILLFDEPNGCKVIETDLGQIRGTPLTTVFGGKPFCGYRGIKYGQPPVGDLRFKVRVKM